MNWQTKKILEEAKDVISDEGVFSADQIGALQEMLNSIAEAIEKESLCISSGIKH